MAPRAFQAQTAAVPRVKVPGLAGSYSVMPRALDRVQGLSHWKSVPSSYPMARSTRVRYWAASMGSMEPKTVSEVPLV